MSDPVTVHRLPVVLAPDPQRVLFRPFDPADALRASRIFGRVAALGDADVQRELAAMLAAFRQRHPRFRSMLLQRYRQVRRWALVDGDPDEARQLLIGAYFTQEYALESSALFNPSMVWHPDSAGRVPGERRFVLSLRALGEGHLSCIAFRSGVVDGRGEIRLDPVAPMVGLPEVHPDPSYDKPLFRQKLAELGLYGDFAHEVLAGLPGCFTLQALRDQTEAVLRRSRGLVREADALARGILALAEANYEVEFRAEQSLSERILYPGTPAERKGIEDARFVHFTDEDGSRTYYATYTAWDGSVFFPQLLETRDFLRFRSSTLNGPEVRNKGFALFPRRIRGRYAMLGRQDGENLYLMYSDNVHFWYRKTLLARPTYPWEYVQIGNCGSPIETEAGWLVLTHGVGPMRRYAIGALLLDREDPSRILGRLPEPLIAPNENEREGYVPNVVYSCGAQIHAGHLILPYAMADYATTFARIELGELLEALLAHPPQS